MTRHDLIDRLTELPRIIARGEVYVWECAQALAVAKQGLIAGEDSWLLAKNDDGSCVLDGKNETVRAAQLRQKTRNERHAVEAAEERYSRACADLRGYQAEFSALKAVARLMSPAD